MPIKLYVHIEKIVKSMLFMGIYIWVNVSNTS